MYVMYNFALINILSLLWLANDVLGFGWGQSSWNNQNLQFGVSDCPTFDGNRTGICVSTAAECRNREYHRKQHLNDDALL